MSEKMKEIVRGRKDRNGQTIHDGDRILAVPYKHITKREEVGFVFWADEYSGWMVKIWDNEERGAYHSYHLYQLEEIEVLEEE